MRTFILSESSYFSGSSVCPWPSSSKEKIERSTGEGGGIATGIKKCQRQGEAAKEDSEIPDKRFKRQKSAYKGPATGSWFLMWLVELHYSLLLQHK